MFAKFRKKLPSSRNSKFLGSVSKFLPSHPCYKYFIEVIVQTISESLAYSQVRRSKYSILVPRTFSYSELLASSSSSSFFCIFSFFPVFFFPFSFRCKFIEKYLYVTLACVNIFHVNR